MYPVVLEGPRIKLREFTLDDVEDAYAYASNEWANRFMTWPSPSHPCETQTVLEGWLEEAQREKRTQYELAIELDGHAVGGVGLRINPYIESEAELGYILAEQCWGNGYVTEAASMMIDFGFNELGLHRVEAFHDVENTASEKVMERLGMKYEGVMHHKLKNRQGMWRDSALRAVVADEWVSPVQ